MNILVVGMCGVGKTWVMRQLLTPEHVAKKIKLMRWKEDGKTAIAGVYDGRQFEGTDGLSMAVAREYAYWNKHLKENNLHGIMEGDRFMNTLSVRIFEPYIIKIQGDGKMGRIKRGSSQTEGHLKRIQTRVDKVKAHEVVLTSQDALLRIKQLTNEGNRT